VLNKTGKYLNCVILALFLCLQSQGAKDVEVKFSPQRLVAGEEAYCDIVCTGSFKPVVDKLPQIKGFTWSKSFKRIMQKSSEGYRQEVIRYTFVVEKPGRITFPSFVVRAGGKKMQTEKLFLNVHTAAKTLDLSKYIFAHVRKVGAESYLYKGRALAKVRSDCPLKSGTVTVWSRGLGSDIVVGQAFPVIVDVFYRAGLDTKSIKSNSVKVRNGIVARPKGESSDMTLLEDSSSSDIELDGVKYKKHSFVTSIQAVGVGSVEADFTFTASVSVPIKRGGGDAAIDERSFSGYKDPFARYVRVEYRTEVVRCRVGVTALPAVPEGYEFLGLVGEWGIDAELSESEDGKSAALILSAKGEGVVSEFRAPELSFPGVRVFEPEVRYSGDGVNESGVEATYVLVPLSEDDAPVRVRGCYYSVAREKFIDYEFNSVLKGDAALAQSKIWDVVSAKSDEILPLQTDYSYRVKIPLRKNMYRGMLFVFALTSVGLLGILYKRRRGGIGSDSDRVRRTRALKRRKSLMKAIKSMGQSEIPLFLNNEVRQNICDLYLLPPGSSPTDLKSHVDDELVELLVESEKAVYMSDQDGTAGRFDRKRVLRIVKGCLSVALVMAMSVVFAAGGGIYQSGTDAYADGNFDAALEAFDKELGGEDVSPALLYNIGNCHFEKGDYAQALVYYERVLRMDPRSSDARENLKVTRGKMVMSDVESRGAALELFRDSMRPDEWGFVVFCALLAGIVALAARSKICFGCACVVLVISCSAVWSQVNSSYDSRLHIIVENTMLRKLPSEHSELTQGKLLSGDDVRVLKRSGNWRLVDVGESTGWVVDSTLASVVPEL